MSKHGAKRPKHRDDGGKVFASPEDQAMLSKDEPLTPERANQIYDAYERVGGGKDVSDTQFVKNSQNAGGPFAGLSDGISAILRGNRFKGYSP